MKPILRVSWSRLREWMSCPWRYDMMYNQDMVAKRTRPAMQNGSIFHRALEAWYRGEDVAVRMGDIETATGNPIPPEVRDSVYAYTQYVTDRGAKDFIPKLVEFPFEIPLNQLTLMDRGVTRYRVSFVGVMDLVATYGSTLALIDHKLQTNMPSVNATDHLGSTYPQLPIYCWASNFLGHPIFDAVLNVTSIRRTNDKTKRFPIRFTSEQLAGWETWLYDQIIAMLTTSNYLRNLGSISCSDCFFAVPCELSMMQSEMFSRVVKQDFRSKSEGANEMEWQRSFPEAFLKEVR